MATVKKSEKYIVKNPRAGMVCIKFIGDLGDGNECIEIARGKKSVFYWHGDKKDTQAYQMWETTQWDILSDLEMQIGQGFIPNVWVKNDVYYKLVVPESTIDRWESALARLSDRVTEEHRDVYYRCAGIRGTRKGAN